jgi:hypothetical protein
MKVTSENKFLEKLFNDSFNSDDDIITFNNGKYENRLFEIKFKIPDNWHYLEINNYSDIIGKQILSDIGEAHKDEIINLVDSNTCFVTKYDINSKDHDGIVSPSNSFSIVLKEDKTSLEEYAELINTTVAPQKHILKKFNVLGNSGLLKIDGYMLSFTRLLFIKQPCET